MSKENPWIGVRGQRPCNSAFFFCASKSNKSSSSEENVKMKIPKKGTSSSLSDFLNRKLHRSCVLPNSLQGKERLISSAPSKGNVVKSVEGHKDSKRRVETNEFPLDFDLDQFKCTRNTKHDSNGFIVNGEDDVHESTKRKAHRSSLIVIGDDPKHPLQTPKQVKGLQGAIGSKKPSHLFNHYGNGKGWWDSDMEGVDNENVGSKEVWEGVCSATVGGIEWH